MGQISDRWSRPRFYPFPSDHCLMRERNVVFHHLVNPKRTEREAGAVHKGFSKIADFSPEREETSAFWGTWFFFFATRVSVRAMRNIGITRSAGGRESLGNKASDYRPLGPQSTMRRRSQRKGEPCQLTYPLHTPDETPLGLVDTGIAAGSLPVTSFNRVR